MNTPNTAYKIMIYLAKLPTDHLIPNGKAISDLRLDNDTYYLAWSYLTSNGYIDGGKTHIGLSNSGRLKFNDLKKLEDNMIYETVFENYDYTLFHYFFIKDDFVSLSEIPEALKSNVPVKVGLNDFPIINYLFKFQQYIDHTNDQYRINENGKKYYFNLKKKMESNNQVVPTYINANMGSIVNFGNNNTFNVVFNNPGDQKELIEKLKEIQIQQDEIDELLLFIETEKPKTSESEFGNKTKSWLKKMMSKSIDGTWQIGIATAGGILVEILKKYYGY